jgi:hypothetical protein
MASLLSGFKDQVTKMLPMLIEQNEPMLEQKLRETLRTVKASNPNEAQLFLANWRKLNTSIEAELSAPAMPVAGKRKRKQTVRRRKY